MATRETVEVAEDDKKTYTGIVPSKFNLFTKKTFNHLGGRIYSHVFSHFLVTFQERIPVTSLELKKISKARIPKSRHAHTQCVYVFRYRPVEHYLTIRPVARKGYGSIAHEAQPNGLLTRGP